MNGGKRGGRGRRAGGEGGGVELAGWEGAGVVNAVKSLGFR